MTTKTQFRKQAKSKSSTSDKKPTKRIGTKSPPIQSTSIPGLKGKGLLRLGDEARLELRDRLNMARPIFSRVVNVSERTIAKVEAQSQTATKLQRPYNEVYRLLEALDDVIDANSLGSWFQSPNEAFEGLKPLEVIERGEIDRLWTMVFELQSGMPG